MTGDGILSAGRGYRSNLMPFVYHTDHRDAVARLGISHYTHNALAIDDQYLQE